MGKLISFQYSLCLRGKIKKKEVIVVPTVFKYFFLMLSMSPQFNDIFAVYTDVSILVK